MGSENNSPSPSGKRSRDTEDEVYVDNLHSHKRYLSEMMASSLNGLTVGDPVPETSMDSPARSDGMSCLRDEISLQYSPMSEDLDDARYCETPMSACSSQSESRPTSPVSPYHYKPVSAISSSPPYTSQPSSTCTVLPCPSSQPRQRGSDTADGRFPSSPSDVCHSGDLRRAALLRSVQMRAQPPGPSAFDMVQEQMSSIEGEARPCSCMKSLNGEREYQIDVCSEMGVSESEFDEGRPSMVADRGKADGSGE